MNKYLVILLSAIVIIVGCTSSKKSVQPATEALVDDVEFQQLTEQARQDSMNFELHTKVAKMHSNRGLDDEAISWYDKALQRNSDYIPALIGKGEIFIQQGKQRDGYGQYLRALMLDKSGKYAESIANAIGQPYQISQITHGNHDNAAPCFSPKGKSLLFQSNRDGNMEIYSLELETNYEKRLTDHPAKDEFPVVSPNGKVIAFISTRDDSGASANSESREIYFMDLDGNHVARFTTNDADDWYPSFDSEGNKLLYVSTSGDIRDIAYHKQWSDIYLHDIKKNEIERLTEGKFQTGTPCLSDDGKWLLYNMNPDDNFDIYKMDLETRNTIQLTSGSGNNAAPEFSPNSKQITFFSDRNGNCDIFLMNSDGSNVQQLTCDAMDEAYPRFSPDGKKIVYHARKGEKMQIFWIDLEKPIERDNLVKIIESRMTELAVMK
ncbi:PD40 domain-containing protein [candidate division KSB1 bacterium]|nr:PD40 domain-containing protein [candidate division KSB1 bacterium]